MGVVATTTLYREGVDVGWAMDVQEIERNSYRCRLIARDRPKPRKVSLRVIA